MNWDYTIGFIIGAIVQTLWLRYFIWRDKFKK